MTTYDIIGDIHGCKEEFLEVINALDYVCTDHKIIYHSTDPNRYLCFVGDINDRGPFSREMIEILYTNRHNDRLIYNPGNHDNKLARYFRGNKVHISHNLQQTVQQFDYWKLSERKYITSYLDRLCHWFMNYVLNHKYYTILENKNLVITHGGFAEYILNESINNDTSRSLCLYGKVKDGIRLPWYNDYHGNAYIVYGHMPTNEPRIINNTFGIDTGCCFGGYLTALTMEFNDKNQLVCNQFVKRKAKQIYYQGRYNTEGDMEFTPPQYKEKDINATRT